MPEFIFKITEDGQKDRLEPVKLGMKIGRDPRNEIVLTDANSSGRHAEIVAHGDSLAIEDLGSSNKTRIADGPALSKGEKFPLTDGTKMMLGKAVIQVMVKQSQKIERTEAAPIVSRGTKTEPQPIHPYGDAAAKEPAPVKEVMPDADTQPASKADRADAKPSAAKKKETKAEPAAKPKAEAPATKEPAKEAPAKPVAPAEPSKAEQQKAITEEQAQPKLEEPAKAKEVANAEPAPKPEAKVEPAPKEEVKAAPPAEEKAKAEPAPKPKAEPKADPAPAAPAAEKAEAPAKPEEAKPTAEPKVAPAEAAKPAAKPVKKKPPLPEIPEMTPGTKEPKHFTINRYEVNLSTYSVKNTQVQCEDFEDVLGGAARGFKILEGFDVDDPHDVKAPLVLNLGCLSGSQFMTGLRTYFHAYSPLKASLENKPSAMWTAGSGKFGTKLRYLGIDEVVFTGRAVKPVYLRVHFEEGSDTARFSFESAGHLAGKHANEKIQHFYSKYPDGHFAVIGPAGENYENVNYSAIALSTINQLRSGDMKSRFCGRGGIGGVMGSKNLLGIVADCPDGKRAKVDGLKEMNQWVARGEGSRRFRDKKKGDGGGGTWANMIALDPLNAMPEYNFNPTGTETSKQLWREEVEKGDKYIVKDEACFACGIACHKNMYTKDENGKKDKYLAKFDYEPLNLLSSNIGIYDIGEAAVLVELVDDLCMDSISIGVTLSYAMEYNKRCKDAGKTSILPDYIEYGNFEGAKRAIKEIGTGQLPVLGQGTKRLSEALGETGYAMHCKGVEFPAYMPHVNPGYPWALAGGHMSMKTYLLYVFEKESGMDYWVDAITKRGPMIIRDDLIGVCKFSAMSDEHMTKALGAMSDLAITEEQLRHVVMRTFLRGYKLEKKQGFVRDDYCMPGESLVKQAHMDLEHFNTPEFFTELQGKVSETLDRMLVDEGI
ncbi:MAG: aldehyde:ferredoxin oxidoreductase [Planctomycetota bacterium]|jgi:aldehyde:ferredoxin oxidoreductase